MPNLMLATGTKYKSGKSNYKKLFSHDTDLGLLHLNSQKICHRQRKARLNS